MSNSPVFEKVAAKRVVAVLVIDDEEHAVPLAEALLDGGVDIMELTLRTNAAMGALKRIRTSVPEMIAGIGTILTPDQAKAVHDADASFGVSPGLNERVLETARNLGLPFAPGIVTPSDIERALEYDLRVLKFFPAGPSGGLSYLNAIAAPYQHLGVRYLPLGGVNQENMGDYLANPNVAAIGGSWIATRKTIEAGDWATITANAKAATTCASALRALS
ncbi:MAG: bifunctional 4-hydroxy-2-oxoglutarate aldolase/2-dehydro-3-deoxy-phosphogluconate aldolase [Verrucomicrobiaceae bacterium]|nr:bifunctional 4-hydroxy-2-oxoglutarate aldolase/2-dehydro-3-deoxy-phosphogluconate aldolase [Verrucomicrobiaceae bacterium]